MNELNLADAPTAALEGLSESALLDVPAVVTALRTELANRIEGAVRQPVVLNIDDALRKQLRQLDAFAETLRALKMQAEAGVVQEIARAIGEP